MSDWYPHVLAAASDGHGGGADGSGQDEQPPQTADQSTEKPRRRRSSKATPGYAGNWRARNVEMRQRIADWFRWTRQTKLHMSRYELADAALADGVELTEPVVRRLENMTNPAVAEARHWLAIEYILWLAAYSGQSFIDVARFLVGGDWAQLGVLTDSTPSDDAMADRVRATFMNLTYDRKRGALDHLIFLQSLDDRDRARATGGRRLSAHTQHLRRTDQADQPDETMEYAIDPGTQAVIDDLEHGAEELRQRLIEHERDNPRNRKKRSDRPSDTSQDDQQRKPG